jgi:hypothetical protein
LCKSLVGLVLKPLDPVSLGENMTVEGLFRRGTTLVLVASIFATFSMIAFAAPGQAVGVLTVSGRSSDPDASVTINGEAAKSGRTLFSSGLITTPEGLTATLNLGKAGRIQIEPNSVFSLNVVGDAVGGQVTAGNVTVVESGSTVSILNAAGESVSLGAGETAAANSASSSKKAKPGPGGLDWWYWAAIAGGVTAVIIAVAVSDDNNSPTR